MPKGSNRVGFRNAEVDELIVDLRETFDPRRASFAMSQRVHAIRLIYESQAYSFFRWPEESPFCWWKDVHDVRFAKSAPADELRCPWWVESQSLSLEAAVPGRHRVETQAP